MTEGGVENPVFEPPSPDLRRQQQCSAGPPPAPQQVYEEGPCGWGRLAPRALQLCNNAEGYLAAYSLLAIFQGNRGLSSPSCCPHPQLCGSRRRRRLFAAREVEVGW